MKKSATSLVLVCVMSIFSRLFGASEPDPKRPEHPSEHATVASAESLARKERSTKFLKAKGVPTLASLPAIEDASSCKLRSPVQIAERFLACTIAAVGGETGDEKLVSRILRDFRAEPLLSAEEREFLFKKLGDQQQRVQFSWRYERSWVLLWALGYVEHLDYPPAICPVPKIAELMRGKSVAQLVEGSKPRTLAEVLEEADLIYRIHWAVVEERVNGSVRVPKEIEKGVVQERHAALNWLISYFDQDWDDVTTDT